MIELQCLMRISKASKNFVAPPLCSSTIDQWDVVLMQCEMKVDTDGLCEVDKQTYQPTHPQHADGLNSDG